MLRPSDAFVEEIKNYFYLFYCSVPLCYSYKWYGSCKYSFLTRFKCIGFALLASPSLLKKFEGCY